MTRWAALLAGAALLSARPAAAYSFRVEKTYHDSLTALKTGKFQQALEGFMDVLLEEPAYPGARARLGEAARELVKIERDAASKERGLIMQEIRAMAGGGDDVPGSPSLMRWKRSHERALELAADPNRLEEALKEHAESVRRYPVSFRSQQTFARAKGAFQSKLLAAFPSAAPQSNWKGRWPGSFSTGALGEDLLIEQDNAKRWAESGGLYDGKPPDQERLKALARETGEAEKAREDLLWRSVRAFNFLRRGDYAASEKEWRTILEADPENAEAKFYAERAKQRGAELASKPASPPPAAAPSPRPPPAAARRSKPRTPPAPVLPEADPGSKPEGDGVKEPPSPAGSAPVAASAEVTREWAHELYQKGLRSYSVGNLEEAIRLWSACLEMDSEHPKARKALERAKREKP